MARHPGILEHATGKAPPAGGSDAQVAAYLNDNAEKLFLTIGYLEEKYGGFPRYKFDTDSTGRYNVGYYRRALRDDIQALVSDLHADVKATVCD